MELSDPVWLAIIAAFSAALALISPIILAALTNRARRQEKEQDYARQDAVAKAAKDSADAAKKAAEEVAAKLETTANTTNEKLSTTNEKLETLREGQDVIHTLVNSNMTAAMQSELDTTRRTRVLMSELIELKKTSGHEPSTEALAELKTIDAKITELQANVTGRMEQAKKVNSKAKPIS
jgi:predicted  nucleic acid-binding Zn-ribbon protein